jgi:HEAT repeat protein
MGDSDPKVRIAAVDSLVGFGPAAVSAMVDRLKDKDSGVRGNAAEALGRIGPDAEDAVKPLARAVGDSDARVREVAAWALGKIGPASRDAVPALTQALRDRSLAGC